METTFNLSLFSAAFFGTIALLWLAQRFSKIGFVIVQPYESVLLLGFGKCFEELREPGLWFRPSLLLPGFRAHRVSRQVDFETLTDLHVNDRNGTTVRFDLWVEFRVEDARQSVFGVESWRDALRNLLIHSLTAAAAGQELEQMIADRESLARTIEEDLRRDAKAWGVRLEQVMIQDIRILPEIAKQFFDRVAAQLEMQKARIEEEARIMAQTLQAQTESRIAALQAEARAMQPLAVGRAYAKLSDRPVVMTAYEELYQLSLLQPNRTVTFSGFEPGDVRAIEAAMIVEGEGGRDTRRGATAPPTANAMVPDRKMATSCC